MDSKVRTIFIRLIIIVFCPLSLLLIPSCKENKWTEWKVENEAWLANNKSQPNVHVTASGLQYTIIADPTPTDAKPNRTSYVTCDYTLTLINGNKIEGGHGQFYLGNVISGFAEGCCLVHNNGDIRIYIPYYLGYDEAKVSEDDTYNAAGNEGTEGTQGYIPPYSTLIYDIHICAVSGSN